MEKKQNDPDNDLKYSSQKEESINLPNSPSDIGNSAHLSPKFLSKKIAVLILAVIFLVFGIGIFTLFLGKNYVETNQWENYSNKQFNFKFQYPGSWKLTESLEKNPDSQFTDLVIELKNKKGDRITFASTFSKFNTNECSNNSGDNMGGSEISFTNKKVHMYFSGSKHDNSIYEAYLSDNSVPCISSPIFHTEIQYPEGINDETFIIKFAIPIPKSQIGDSPEIKSIKKIISTFSLIKSGTSLSEEPMTEQSLYDWQTYSNKIYNFSFKYPTDGKIDGGSFEGGSKYCDPRIYSETYLPYCSYIFFSNQQFADSSPFIFGITILNPGEKKLYSLPLKTHVEKIRNAQIKFSEESPNVDGIPSSITSTKLAGLTSYTFDTKAEITDTIGGLHGLVSDTDISVLYLEHNGIRYEIYYLKDNDIGKKILSTFKFTQ